MPWKRTSRGIARRADFAGQLLRSVGYPVRSCYASTALSGPVLTVERYTTLINELTKGFQHGLIQSAHFCASYFRITIQCISETRRLCE